MVLWMKHNMFCIEDLNVSVLKESQRGSFMFQTCFLIVSFIFITHIMDNSIFFQKCRSEVVLDCLRSSAMAKSKMVKNPSRYFWSFNKCLVQFQTDVISFQYFFSPICSFNIVRYYSNPQITSAIQYSKQRQIHNFKVTFFIFG